MHKAVPAVAVLTVAAVLAWLAGQAWLDRSRPAPLRLTISDWPGDQVFALARQMKLGQRSGPALELRRVATADDQSAAFLRGDVDLLPTTLDQALRMTGEDLRLVYAYNDSAGADAVLGSAAVTRPADLAGRRIGVELGFPSHLLALALLERERIDADLVDVQADEAVAALAGGKVDAVATWAPHLQTVLAQVPGSHRLASSAEFPGLILNVLVVRSAALPRQEAALAELVQAVDGVVRVCRPDPRACAALLAQETGRPAEAWIQDFAGVRLLTADDNRAMAADAGPTGLTARIAATRRFLESRRPGLATADLTPWTAPATAAGGAPAPR